MSDHRPAPSEHSFVHQHPALMAALLGIAITGIFLFALYQETQGHHEEGPAPAGSGAARAEPAH